MIIRLTIVVRAPYYLENSRKLNNLGHSICHAQ